MNRHRTALRDLAREFLTRRDSFWDFHEAFLDRWTRLPPDALKPQDRAAWNEIYGWILIAIPDPVSPADRARGVVGEAELRERMLAHPLLAEPASPRERR
jgi:hypothetical protein